VHGDPLFMKLDWTSRGSVIAPQPAPAQLELRLVRSTIRPGAALSQLAGHSSAHNAAPSHKKRGASWDMLREGATRCASDKQAGRTKGLLMSQNRSCRQERRGKRTASVPYFAQINLVRCPSAAPAKGVAPTPYTAHTDHARERSPAHGHQLLRERAARDLSRSAPAQQASGSDFRATLSLSRSTTVLHSASRAL